MSFKGIILGIKIASKNVASFAKRYLPQIMVGAGVCGFVGTAVASGKAALKTKDILDEKDEQIKTIDAYAAEGAKGDNEYTEEDHKNDIKIVKTQTAVKLAKTFALPVTLGAASTALVLGGNHILGRRAAVALSAAYEAQKKLYSYDKNVVAQLGEETAAKLRDGLKIDKETVADGMKKAEEKAEKAGTDELSDEWVDVPFLYDETSCGHGFGWHHDPYHRWMKIQDAYRHSHDQLVMLGHITINEILWREFSHPGIVNGDHGWICDPHYYGDDSDNPDTKTNNFKWFVDYGHGDIPIKEFVNNQEIRADYYSCENESIWITFRVRKNDISQLYNKINDRKRAKIYR